MGGCGDSQTRSISRSRDGKKGWEWAGCVNRFNIWTTITPGLVLLMNLNAVARVESIFRNPAKW